MSGHINATYEEIGNERKRNQSKNNIEMKRAQSTIRERVVKECHFHPLHR